MLQVIGFINPSVLAERNKKKYVQKPLKQSFGSLLKDAIAKRKSK